MGVLAVFFSRIMAYITVMPKGLLAPLIIIFSIVGTYANSNNVGDVILMMAFGVLGYLMYKFNFSTAAVLLGLILGPIAENGLRDLLVVSQGSPIYFTLQRPLSLILIALIVLVLIYSSRQQEWEKNSQDLASSVDRQ